MFNQSKTKVIPVTIKKAGKRKPVTTSAMFDTNRFYSMGDKWNPL